MSTPAAPVAPPAPTPAPAAAPVISSPAPAAIPIAPPRVRPTVSAAKALGLPEAPSKTASGIVSSQNKRNASHTGSSHLPPSPTRGNAPATVINPAPLASPTEPEGTLPPAPTPAAPAAPAAPVAPAAPATPPPEDKVAKLERELEELRTKFNQPKPADTPAPAPAAPQETPEQKVERERQVTERENTWVADRATRIPCEITAEQIETLNAGGPEAVKMMASLLQTSTARAILEARKSIYSEMNPLVNRLQNENAMLMQNHMALEQHRIEQTFLTTYPDMTPQIDTCRGVAEQLLQHYPDQCRAMTTEAFVAEVYRQSGHVLNTRAKQFGYEKWQDVPVAQRVPPPAPAAPAGQQVPPAPVPRVPAVEPVAPAAPVSPRPPAPHSPVGGGPRQPKTWQGAVAASLRE